MISVTPTGDDSTRTLIGADMAFDFYPIIDIWQLSIHTKLDGVDSPGAGNVQFVYEPAGINNHYPELSMISTATLTVGYHMDTATMAQAIACAKRMQRVDTSDFYTSYKFNADGEYAK